MYHHYRKKKYTEPYAEALISRGPEKHSLFVTYQSSNCSRK